VQQQRTRRPGARQRPLGPGHRQRRVDAQRVAGRLAGAHQRVLAAREVHLGQHRPLPARRLGFGTRPGCGGRGRPGLAAATPQNLKHLRVQRRQPLFGPDVAGRFVRLQQRQRGQHGVVLHRLLAEQPVHDAGIGVERSPSRRAVGHQDPGAADGAQQGTRQRPGPARKGAKRHAPILPRWLHWRRCCPGPRGPPGRRR
jgi:hypothetical protein